MSKIRKRDFVKRNFTARQDLNRHADVFKDLKHSTRGGRHGEKVELEHELDKEENEPCSCGVCQECNWAYFNE